MGITSRALMILAAGLLVLSYLSMFFNPASAWFMTLLGLIFVPVWLLNAFLLVWAILRKSKAALIPLLAIIPSLFIVGRYYQFQHKKDVDGDLALGNTAKIISYNVGRFRMSSKRNKTADPSECMDSVVKFLSDEDPDIVCLQEVQYPSAEQLKKYFSSRFPGYDIEYFVFTTDYGCYGNVTLSKTPVINKGKIDFDGTSNIAIYSDYEIQGKKFRVYNCHLQSYNISVSRLANVLTRLISGDSSGGDVLKDTEQKMKSSIVRRPRQVEAVLSDIENSPYEAIVTGDFNDTPMSYTYYRLRMGRRDTFVEAGKGFGATYTLLRPFVRIDYILFPGKYPIVSHEVEKVYYSDHFPVIATVSIDNPQQQ